MFGYSPMDRMDNRKVPFKMNLLPEPLTKEALDAIPDGAEVLLTLSTPYGLMVQLGRLEGREREGMTHLAEEHAEMIIFGAFVLPDIEVPDAVPASFEGEKA